MQSLLHQREKQIFRCHQHAIQDLLSVVQAYQMIPWAWNALRSLQYNITPVLLEYYSRLSNDQILSIELPTGIKNRQTCIEDR